MSTIRAIPLAILSLYGVSSQAEEPTPITVTTPVVVTATRVGTNSFDLPVAIDVVNKENIQDGQLQMTLSESLIRVPGITAQNRSQMAQDPQISTRGFGARSAFGVRGVRVYLDGIPLTMPDGIGQPGVADLSVIKSIEVMRGPFSALYGNSSGGVVQLLTEDAPKRPEIGAEVMLGSDNTKRQSVRAAGTSEGIEYLVNYSNFDTDGYRDHSASRKEQGTAKFKINFSEDTKLTTLVNWFDQKADDPGGLRRTSSAGEPSAFADPSATTQAALRANTRVERSHTQVGFNLEHKINDNNTLNLITYVGTRENLQYLSLNSVGGGRASKISRDFWGTDLRWNNTGEVFSRPYTLSAGLTYARMNDDRLDSPALNGSVSAIPTRNEKNIAANSDQYLQGKLAVLDNLDIFLGVRRSKVTLRIDDNLVTTLPLNPDNSGSLTYEKTTPVIGAVWKVNRTLNLYANYGKGFETPTFIEVAYLTPSINSSPNFGLKPSNSKNLEVGAKAFLGASTQANLTLFKIMTDDEIIAQTSGTFSTSINAGKTTRNGAEASIDSQLPHNFAVFGAYTLLNAKFDSDFLSAGNAVSSGNVIPGTYHTQLYGEVSWKHPETGFRAALEGRHNSKTYVNDTNSDAAPSYTIYNIRAGFTQNLENWRISEYVRVENIFDKDYIGSVRVNDGNLRFFEPAVGRNYLVGLSASYSF